MAWEAMMDLIKVERSAVVTNLPFHVGSLPAHLSSRNWKSTRLKERTERGNPRYRIWKEVLVADTPSRMLSRSMPMHLIGTMELFSKFVCSPVTNPKWPRMSAMFRISSLIGNEYRRVILIEGIPKDGTPTQELVEESQVRGMLQDLCKRVNAKDKEKWGEGVSLSQPSAMKNRWASHPIKEDT
jgi:hypothetical protein